MMSYRKSSLFFWSLILCLVSRFFSVLAAFQNTEYQSVMLLPTYKMCENIRVVVLNNNSGFCQQILATARSWYFHPQQVHLC